MNWKIGNIKDQWLRVKHSVKFRNVLLFLIFVAIATVFWFIIALNDNISETFRVKLKITAVPDSVTFITDPPAEFHVTVRDKGTNILRSGVVKQPEMSVNFADYCHEGVFRLTNADIMTELKTDIGGMATITSSSLDSLRLYYTTSPGHRVPVIVKADLTPASGYMVQGTPVLQTRTVKIYSYHDEIDTVRAVYTKTLVKKGLSQTSVFEVPLQPIPHVKIVPSKVEVKVHVEPLVHKEVYVKIDVINAPQNENLLLFPNRVPVSMFVPMSKFGDENYQVCVQVDYNDVHSTNDSRVPVYLVSHAPGLVNVELKQDSVEYTLVKH